VPTTANDNFRESTIDVTGDASTDNNSDGDGGVDSGLPILEDLFS